MIEKLFATSFAPASGFPNWISKAIGMPEQASTAAGTIDRVYFIILSLSTIFFIGIILATIYFMLKYRRKSADQKTSPLHENFTLEMVWIAIPTVLMVWIFLEGFRAWMPMNYAPADAMEVRVTAQQWKWMFTYPSNGIRNAPELVVPVGKPVKLIMSSVDVIHSFYVPAFRVKRDVLPNRYTVLWFQTTKTGTFNLFCTEYCGKDHSSMITRVRVMEEADYKKWLIETRNKGLNGKALYANYGCNACHSLKKGERLQGPSFYGLYNRMEKVLEGGVAKKIKVDDNYLRTSILYPNKHIVEGYGPVMPTFKGRISTEEINALIDFIKTIGGQSAKKK